MNGSRVALAHFLIVLNTIELVEHFQPTEANRDIDSVSERMNRGSDSKTKAMIKLSFDIPKRLWQIFQPAI